MVGVFQFQICARPELCSIVLTHCYLLRHLAKEKETKLDKNVPPKQSSVFLFPLI